MKRKVALAEGGVYHIFNRGIEKRTIFPDDTFYLRFLNTVKHTLNYDYPYSLLKSRLEAASSVQAREAILEQLEMRRIEPPVAVISYCSMPNHFHFTLKQLEEDGITKFVRRVCTSYTKYFNMRLDRVGGLFQSRFRAVLVETDEQLIHLTRYQHINPRCLGLETGEELITYPWSSFSAYVGERELDFLNAEPVLSNFSSKKEYLEFVMAEVDDFEPLRLVSLAIDDDFGWFKKFRDLEKEQKERLQKRYMELLSQQLC